MREKALGWVNLGLGALNLLGFLITGSILIGVIGTWCFMLGAIFLVD